MTSGPQVVSTTFKVFALIAIVFGFVAILIDLHDHDTASTFIGLVAGTALSAATLAFFAYVLDLLMDIRSDTEVIAEMSLLEDDDTDEVASEASQSQPSRAGQPGSARYSRAEREQGQV